MVCVAPIFSSSSRKLSNGTCGNNPRCQVWYICRSLPRSPACTEVHQHHGRAWTSLYVSAEYLTSWPRPLNTRLNLVGKLWNTSGIPHCSCSGENAHTGLLSSKTASAQASQLWHTLSSSTVSLGFFLLLRF